MIFTLNPSRVTKELLLNNRTEEEYMSFYLGIVPDNELHTNPLRKDNRPTASFYRARNNELVFKDWATAQHFNFVDIVMEKYNVNYGKALNIIANDFGIIQKDHYEKHEAAIEYTGAVVENKGETIIQIEVQDFTTAQLKWWLSFGITEKTLKKFHVFSAKNVFLNGNYLYSSSETNPIYGYYFGKKEGRELWKLYFPLRTQFRFLLNCNELQGVKQLPKTGDLLVITKSLKDVMVFYEMGIPAVAPQAESVIISARQYAALKKRFKVIIFNGDWDRAGQRFMAESRKKFEGIALSFSNKKKHAKDVSDFTKKFGFVKAQAFIHKVRDAILAGKFNYQFRYSMAA